MTLCQNINNSNYNYDLIYSSILFITMMLCQSRVRFCPKELWDTFAPGTVATTTLLSKLQLGQIYGTLLF